MPRAALSVSLLLLALPTTVAAAPKSFNEDKELVVEGEYLKPEVTVVISRENLNKPYDLTLDEDFLQRIVDSVKVAPF